MMGCVLLLALQGIKPAPPHGMPAANGVYYQSGADKWIPLKPVAMANTKAKGLENYLQTEGYTNLGVTAVYQGGHASAQFTIPRPGFYVRGIGSPTDAMIVQLAAKKDARMLQMSSGLASVENKGGFKKEEIHKVGILEYDDGSFSVAPEHDLKEGEYLLVFGYPDGGFDFGIHAASRQ
jgi:hypothetical protein